MTTRAALVSRVSRRPRELALPSSLNLKKKRLVEILSINIKLYDLTRWENGRFKVY